MSWMQKLYDTYENCKGEVGVIPDDKRAPLAPIAHVLQQSQIEIVLDQDGSIHNARLIPKGEARTIIPCTEDSGSRSGSDPKSHPLCDKLQYVAKDFIMFVKDASPKYIKKLEKLNKSYIELLTNWCESEFSHSKAKAVLEYVKKGTVTKDLIDYEVLKCEANRKIKQKSANLFVRWIVNISNDLENKSWCDKSLFDSWIRFDESDKKDSGLCYVTGKKIRLAKNHPKYIRVPGDSAKLISSNDDTGFTYRGRFINAKQACNVGFEITQKAHNALRWLISRQGKVFQKGESKEPGLTIVAWATSGDDIPQPIDDSYALLKFDQIESDTEFKVYTAQKLAIQLIERIAGYSTNINDTTDIVVMGLDSATPGRLSITFYRELSGSEFLAKINKWHETCCWIHEYHTKKITNGKTGKEKEVNIRFVGAPAPGDIALAAYGHYENKRFVVDSKLQKTAIERILPCIIDGQKIPRDLVDSVVRRASNRVGMEEKEWNKTLSIACALYKKYNEKEEYNMALDENRKTRDYLYGRLLAIADNIEQRALKESGEKRPTTANRLMQRFADHPYTTWRTIKLSLRPYEAKLGNYRQKVLDEVMNKFDSVDDFKHDKPLSGEFLLGYHCQRAEFWQNKKENSNGSEEHENVKE